jgi:hypothetical protein
MDRACERPESPYHHYLDSLMLPAEHEHGGCSTRNACTCGYFLSGAAGTIGVHATTKKQGRAEEDVRQAFSRDV